MEKSAHERLDPGRHGRQTVFQIIPDSRTVTWVVENSVETRHVPIPIGWKQVLYPIQRLHNTHGRAARPIKPAWSCLLESDGLAAQLNGAETIVGKHRYVGGYRCCQAKVVCCRQSIHDEASLIPSSNCINHSARVRHRGSLCELVETGLVV